MPSRKPSPKASAQKNIFAKQLLRLVSDEWKREVPDGYVPKMCDSLALLSDDEIWWRANEASNSIGNLILHLCGNMRQWIIAGLGGAEDIRQRDLEFSERGPIPRAELIEKLRATVQEASRVVRGLSAEDLLRPYSIQGYRVAGFAAAIHVTTHIAYHAGQILYVAKMKRARDLGFTRLPPVPAKKTAGVRPHRSARRFG